MLQRLSQTSANLSLRCYQPLVFVTKDNENCVHICDSLELREQKLWSSESLEYWQGLIAKYLREGHKCS